MHLIECRNLDSSVAAVVVSLLANANNCDGGMGKRNKNKNRKRKNRSGGPRVDTWNFGGDHVGGARKRKREMERQRAAKDKDVQLYKGATLHRHGASIDRLDPSRISPSEFFAKYVVPRQPVVLTSVAEDKNWKGNEKWTNDYLKSCAGEGIVRVEYRNHPTGRFGMGQEKQMKFGDFVDLIAAGDALHYLTTQDLKLDEEGRPGIMSPPVTELFAAGDFSLRPRLLPHLVLFNANVWFGNSPDGSSSGLHHDFHDNLYILLRGKKRFRLYSPADALNMYTTGKIVKVHENGRINYDGALTRADGADPIADAAAEAALEQERAELDLEAAEASGDQGRIARAEGRVEKAMDVVLSIQMNDDAFGDMVEGSADGQEASSSEGSPLNFCKVDPNLSPSVLADKFPKFLQAKETFCEVNAGEMLYLPAGWFHEVTSCNASPLSTGKNEKGGHLAFNYWFHPPDNVGNGSGSFARPYTSDFWKNDFAMRVKGNKNNSE